jgi:hypothetical protein
LPVTLLYVIQLSDRVYNVTFPAYVLIPIPNVYRGKGDSRNVMAVVTERVHNGYKLGTSGGMLLGSYTRNQFELSDSQFLDKETVDKTSEISLRNAVRSVSVCQSS